MNRGTYKLQVFHTDFIIVMTFEICSVIKIKDGSRYNNRR